MQPSLPLAHETIRPRQHTERQCHCAGAESDLETAFAELVQRRVDAVVVPSDALFNSVPNEIVALAAHHRLPAIYAYSEGLMSYGGSFNEPFRQAGLYTGRIWDRAPSAKILEKVVFNDRGERVGLVDDIIVTQESARQTQS